jgi:hypothetical protein
MAHETTEFGAFVARGSLVFVPVEAIPNATLECGLVDKELTLSDYRL